MVEPHGHAYYHGFYGSDLIRVASADLSLKIDALTDLVKELKGNIMSLTAEVQALVDQVAANTSAEASAAAAEKQLATQIADLQAQIAAIVPGAAISPEDLAAIVASTSSLKDSMTALVGAIPANT